MKNKQMSKILNAFEIKNETATSADLYFYGDIVADYWGTCQEEDQYPDAVKNFLSGQQGKSLNIFINSGGGSVFAGLAIYQMIKRFSENCSVKVYVDGLAGSIASVIAFAGSEPPKIPANAFLMIHNPWAEAEGNAEELRKMADDLDVIAAGMMNVYMENVKDGITEDQIKELMAEETWMNGTQAAEYFNITVTDQNPEAAVPGEYVASCKKIPKDMKILKVTNSSDNSTREANRIEENKKRDAIARIIINNI